MKITIVYDNTSFKKDLQSDWGFAALVESEGVPRILFDTGANGRILLDNMGKLDIDPKSVDEVFISHPHFDHIGGLSSFLEVNKKSEIYVPSSLRGIKGRKVITIRKPQKIHDKVFSTGELEGIEQSMGIKIDKGIILIVGCSHPGVENILEVATQFGEVSAIIGGLHGFNKFELLEDLNLICPTHCTQYKDEIKSRYPQKYIEGGVGKVIEI